MALINNYYVFVETESVTRGIEMSTHAVESGLDITDNVKKMPMAINLSGEIVGDNASSVLSDLQKLHQSGKYIKYIGRNIMNQAIISTFDTDHPNTINGGCAFTMTLTEMRVANSAYIAPTATKQTTKGGTQQVQSNTSSKKYTVKKGDTLWAIAKAYYGSGAQFTKIYEANKDKISNPNLIYVGQVLAIP